jgi:hypothetical protein
MRADLGRALDAYEEAKQAFVGDRNREDALDVLRVLDEGRHALACLDARLAGDPLPAQLPLCFFDARHGPSTTQLHWAPEDGAPRNIAVCAADAVRLAESREPIAPRSRGSAVAQPRAAGGRATPAREPTRSGPKAKASREVSGKGSGRQQVALPEAGRPAVLEFRTKRPAHVTVLVYRAQGGRPRGYQLHSADGPIVTRVPLVRTGARKVVRFELEFGGKAREAWQARTEPLDAIPAFDVHARGEGFDVVRYRGAVERAVLRHCGRGAFVLQALDDNLAEWATVAEGMGDAEVAFTWPGPGYYQVRCHGMWTLTQEPES